MAERDNQNNRDLEQDEDIIELTEIVEDGGDAEEPLLEEPVDSEEEVDLAPETEAESSSPAEEMSSETTEEISDSTEDLDFDALFEELDQEPAAATEGEERISEGVTFGPEEEAELTGGIHTSDGEDDFDALLEDLDKQDDMLPFWEEPEEESLEKESSESAEPGPEKPDPEERLEEEGEEFDLEDVEGTAVEEEAADLEVDTPAQEVAPEREAGLKELEERLQRLENEQLRPQIQDEDLSRALSSLPADSDVWTGLEERFQKVVDQKIREHTGEMEARIEELQEKMDRMASGDFATQQAIDQAVQDVRSEIPSREELETQKQTLRTELLQEMESQIPAAASRILREEIENLRSGSQEES